MNAFNWIWRPVAVLMLAGALCVPAAAAEGALGAEWKPLDASRLDALRGGFIAPSGLVISFGIERVVQVNGEVVASTRLQIADVSRVSADEARMLAALRDSQIVHVGGGTVVAGGTGGLLIQNTIDGQSLSARTTLDVSLNTLQLYRDGQLATLITDAVISGLPSL